MFFGGLKKIATAVRTRCRHARDVDTTKVFVISQPSHASVSKLFRVGSINSPFVDLCQVHGHVHSSPGILKVHSACKHGMWLLTATCVSDHWLSIARWLSIACAGSAISA